MSTVSYILFVEKWKSLEEEGAENMQKKVGLNDRRVYFDMDGTIAKWRDVPVDETRKPGYYADLEPETELLDFMRTASLCRTERTRQSSSRQCCIGNFVLKIS